jgi:DNA primase
LRIPPEKIDDVRQATDIVELIGGFVKLKKRGKNYLGLCPFHTEKTPSFSVSSDRQMYHCFGCGVGGNVFTFVMEQEKISFVEAVRILAEKAGISLPAYSPDQDQFVSEQEQLYEICRDAGLFFHKSLTESTEGKLALEYFHHRGFSDDTIRIFGLGYSPNTWDAYISHAVGKALPIQQVEQSGLARKRDDGSYYDYFRGRAMFPVFSASGRVVGFGARKVYEDDPIAGKYINSPETLIYEKSKILYGLYQSKDSLREEDFAILVEGYADLITLYQSGIRNVVASSGTALTKEQILLIGRYTKKITIVYDADSAGSKAALRGVDLILDNDLDVRVARLPDGDDPDTFVRKAGYDGFKRLLENAVSFIDFIAQTFEREGKLSTPEGQAETVRAIVHSIAKMNDELKRNFYIKRVAEKYKIYESTLYRELEKHLGRNRKDMQRETERVKAIAGLESSGKSLPDVSQSIPVAERDLLHAMFDGGTEVIRYVFENMTLEEFTHPISRDIAEHLLQRTEEGLEPDPSRLVNELEDESMKRLVAEIVFSKYSLSKSWEARGVDVPEADAGMVARGALLSLRRRLLEKKIEENRMLLKTASQRGENIDKYLESHQVYLQQLQDLQ